MSDTSANHPEVHVQNISKGKLSDGVAKRLLCLRGEPEAIAAFTSEFRTHASVKRFKRVAGDTDSSIGYFSSEIVFDNENPSILSRIHNRGCFQHNSVSVKRGMEHWKIYTEDTQTVHELVDELESLGNDVALYQNTDLESLEDTRLFDFAKVLSDLTPRQQAAFETALSLGYYNSDADITTEEIAEALDVNQSTAWEHMKKAENKILTAVGEQLFAEEPLSHGTNSIIRG